MDYCVELLEMFKIIILGVIAGMTATVYSELNGSYRIISALVFVITLILIYWLLAKRK